MARPLRFLARRGARDEHDVIGVVVDDDGGCAAVGHHGDCSGRGGVGLGWGEEGKREREREGGKRKRR